MRQEITAELVKNIYPLNKLTTRGLTELQRGMRVRWLAPGRPLFNVAESPDEYYYVLSGSIQLVDETEEEFTTVSPSAHTLTTPLPYIIPSLHRAFAIEDSQILHIDRHMLERVLAKDQPQSAQVMESPPREDQKGGDWMTAMLAAPGYKRLAPQNMRRLFDHMERVEVKKGDVIIEQNQIADYFYVVASGRCEVLRAFPPPVSKMVQVAEYGPGASIGEDALISNMPRNATVRMLSDGVLMRLDGDEFRFLVKPGLCRPVEYAIAKEMVSRGGVWLDVRMPGEAKTSRVRGAMSIPHPIARSRLFTADPDKSYIVVCATRHDSPVIAFTLCKYGFDAYYLKGGIASLPTEQLEAQAPGSTAEKPVV